MPESEELQVARASAFSTLERTDRHDLKHAVMHVVHEVAVERPVARLVGRKVECRAAARLNDHGVL